MGRTFGAALAGGRHRSGGSIAMFPNIAADALGLRASFHYSNQNCMRLLLSLLQMKRRAGPSPVSNLQSAPDDDIKWLIEQAEKCRRLAQAAAQHDESIALELLDLAQTLESAAAGVRQLSSAVT